MFQVPIPKNVPYFTALDIEEDGLCKHVFLFSSSSSLEVTCLTQGGGEYHETFVHFYKILLRRIDNERKLRRFQMGSM